MPDDRERLGELLVPWLDRRAGGTRADLPVILLWAPRASGADDLLAHVARQQDVPAPVASIDGRLLGSGMRPHEVALFSMWPLGKHIRGFGRIRFPRFLLGLAAIRGPVAPLPRTARNQIVTTILGDSARLRAWLGQLLRAVAESAGAGGQAADLAAQTLEGLLESARELHRRRSAPVAWYREGLGESFADPFQALAQLGRSEAQGERALVDVALCRAFLADIRAEYQAELRWFARDRNPLLLIDASTRPAPASFVEHLVAAGGPAPLVVVAASTTRQSPSTADPSDWRPTVLADASAADWETHRHRPGWARRYPVAFGVPTTAPRPAGLPVPGQPRRHDPRAEFAHRLTAGHPGGFERVLRIARAGADLRRVFDASDSEDGSFDDDVLRWVVGDPQLVPPRAAVQLALLPDLGPDRLAPVLNDPVNDPVRINRFHRSDMWVLWRAGGVPMMHPFARRALAHRLGRAEVSGLTWQRWHETLRDEALAAGDQRAALHHRLALSEVQTVAAELGTMFRPGNQQEWYEDVLLEVTRAPVARPGLGADAGAHLDELVASADDDGPVRARLVAALQLHTDPLGDPQHQLCAVVADELAELSRGARRGAAYLVNRAAEFNECSNRWRDEGAW